MWLEVDAAAFDIVAYMVAVFFGGEPRDSEFAAVDAQPRNVHGFRRCGICDLNDLLKVFVGLRLARARVSLKKVLVLKILRVGSQSLGLEKRGRALLLCLVCAEAGWLILVNAWLRLERAYLKLRLFLRV